MEPRLPPDLIRVLSRLDADADVSRLLLDLLTPHEIEALAERWEIVKRLDQGESQRAIRDALGASVTTISRGSRQMKYGYGGFRLALDRLSREPQ